MAKKLRILAFGLVGAAAGYGSGEIISKESQTANVTTVEAVGQELGGIAVKEELFAADEVHVTDEGLREGLALIGFGAGVVGASGLISGSRRWYVDHGMTLRSGWTPEDGPSLRDQQVEKWRHEAGVDGFSATKTL